MDHLEFSLWISGAAIAGYACWWTSFLIPWIQLRKKQNVAIGDAPSGSALTNWTSLKKQLTIIIPFRNESQRISPLLQSLTVAVAANLMFKKQAFIDLGGYQGHEHIASGDDVLTMEKFLLSPVHKITYVQHPSATVYTPLETQWDSFFYQRMRWMKKTFLQKTQKTALKQVLLGLFMIFIWVMSAFAVLSAHYETLAFVWLGKLLVDSAGIQILLQKNKPNPVCVLLASAAQVLWLPALAITSIRSKYQWKNSQHTA